MTIQGPRGTGERFRKKVEELKKKGYSDLVARRKVAAANIEKSLKGR